MNTYEKRAEFRQRVEEKLDEQKEVFCDGNENSSLRECFVICSSNIWNIYRQKYDKNEYKNGAKRSSECFNPFLFLILCPLNIEHQ